MYNSQPLNLVGYKNLPLPATFFRQEQKSVHLVVLYPGMGYTVRSPLLYYPTQLCLAYGCDVLWVEYNYRQSTFQATSEDEQQQWLATDSLIALQAGLAQHCYGEVTLMGKSLGTLAIGHILASQQMQEPTASIWLTPILTNSVAVSHMQLIHHRALIVTGTADPVYDALALQQVQVATGAKGLVIEQADHLLEIETDIEQTIAIHQEIVSAIKALLFV